LIGMRAAAVFRLPIGRPARRFLLAATALLAAAFGNAAGAEKLPPAPEHYFNDYAHVASPTTAARLDRQLEDFERQTSNQVWVAIYPTLDTDSSIEDFTQRVAQSWKVGQKLHNNGIVLFVFTQPRKMRIEVGYGLEGAVPDILAKQIIENEIKPAFKAGNYDAGLAAGVDAILKATRGEYKGNGKTTGDQGGGWSVLWVTLIIGFFIYLGVRSARRGPPRGGGGFSPAGGWFLSGAGWGGGWSGSGGGGGFGGGGGGFGGGGGGSFGGGGASGSW
jgi:uncharacterized protein